MSMLGTLEESCSASDTSKHSYLSCELLFCSSPSHERKPLWVLSHIFQHTFFELIEEICGPFQMQIVGSNLEGFPHATCHSISYSFTSVLHVWYFLPDRLWNSVIFSNRHMLMSFTNFSPVSSDYPSLDSFVHMCSTYAVILYLFTDDVFRPYFYMLEVFNQDFSEVRLLYFLQAQSD